MRKSYPTESRRDSLAIFEQKDRPKEGLLATAIGHRTDADKAQDHHGPGGRFGNGTNPCKGEARVKGALVGNVSTDTRPVGRQRRVVSYPALEVGGKWCPGRRNGPRRR